MLIYKGRKGATVDNSSVLGQSIFKTRAGVGGNISRRIYNLILGGCLFWGFIFNLFIVVFFDDDVINNG